MHDWAQLWSVETRSASRTTARASRVDATQPTRRAVDSPLFKAMLMEFGKPGTAFRTKAQYIEGE
jgi:hypothetical protein